MISKTILCHKNEVPPKQYVNLLHVLLPTHCADSHVRLHCEVFPHNISFMSRGAGNEWRFLVRYDGGNVWQGIILRPPVHCRRRCWFVPCHLPLCCNFRSLSFSGPSIAIMPPRNSPKAYSLSLLVTQTRPKIHQNVGTPPLHKDLTRWDFGIPQNVVCVAAVV